MVLHQEKNRQDRISGQNPTGIPTQLKKRMEDNTALELDDVRIHYNSTRPASLGALAYTQGTQVYLGPGQERHLPHELGHVVQQKLGMVRPDTRHESGAMLNTDQALERQADRIGAGSERIAVPSTRHRGEPIVQRMSVLTNWTQLRDAQARGEEPKPEIRRYKRSGWKAVQELKKYLMEDSLKQANMGQLKALSDKISTQDMEQLYEKINSVADGMGVINYQPEFHSKLQEKRNAAEAARDPLEAWNAIAGELRTALEKCAAVEGLTEEEKTQMSVLGLEKKGQYEDQGKIEPYINYKKAAFHCIAKMASQIRGGASVGPHIALSVIGNEIYAAINSHQFGGALMPEDGLATKISKAISRIKSNDISTILKSNESEFEEGADKDKLEKIIPDIYQYIQQLKGYAIKIVDAPAYRIIEPKDIGPIHGEMAIMDFLQHNPEGQQVIVDRNTKLNEITPQQGEGIKRVIWIGGTKVDCAVCHKHFMTLNASNGGKNELGNGLERTYVVSSSKVGNGGEPFPKTENGTHLSAKKTYAEETHADMLDNLLKAETLIVASAPPAVAPASPTGTPASPTGVPAPSAVAPAQPHPPQSETPGKTRGKS